MKLETIELIDMASTTPKLSDSEPQRTTLPVLSANVPAETATGGPLPAPPHTHGTGCTLASAIAANLARGMADMEAIAAARAYVEGAIRNAPGIGKGHGPLAHFWRLP